MGARFKSRPVKATNKLQLADEGRTGMFYRPGKISTRIAFGVLLTVGALAPTIARAQFDFPDPPPPYRPAKDAKDLRSVLFNWTWYMGMLRGVDEHELITSLEYQGKGSIQVDGQPCTL